MDILINLISGAIGGNAIGKAQKSQDLGVLGNTITGLIGGLLGSTALQGIVTNLISNTLGNVIGSAAWGAVAIYIVNFIKGLLSKKKAN